MGAWRFEDGGEPVAGVGAGVGGDLFGGAGGYDLAAAGAAFGAHVDDPVGGFDDVEVVLDDEEGAAAFDEFAEGGEELGDVVEVEAGGGLVEDVEGAAAGFGCGRRWCCVRGDTERAVARCEASLTRWASPPESVVADWPRRT